ncbi:MAG TPA: hypothetical protein VIC51_03060 [Psychromonas sp.]
MRSIIGKKSDLARGFADVNTPSQVENELVFSWLEKREHLKKEIERLTILALNESDKKKKKGLIHERNEARKGLVGLGTKINKRVNYSLLVIDRLMQACSQETFELACRLAKEDKNRILAKFSIND